MTGGWDPRASWWRSRATTAICCSNYVQAGVPVLGVEPARNIAAVAQQRGIPTCCEFFGADVAKQLASTHAARPT